MVDKLENINYAKMNELSKEEIAIIINEKDQLLLEVEQALANTQRKVENMMNERRYYIVQLFNKFYPNEDSSFLNNLTDRQYREIFHGILNHIAIKNLKAFIKEKEVDQSLEKSWEEIRKQNRDALICLFSMYYPDDDFTFIRNLTVSQVREVAQYIENKEKVNEIKEFVLMHTAKH